MIFCDNYLRKYTNNLKIWKRLLVRTNLCELARRFHNNPPSGNKTIHFLFLCVKFSIKLSASLGACIAFDSSTERRKNHLNLLASALYKGGIHGIC